MEPVDDVRIVFVTVPDTETGAWLARALVGESLAACVNVVPGVRSVYRWKGAVEDAGEALLVVKTVAGRLDALCGRIRELHPYDVPEVVAVAVVGGSEAYLDWVRGEVRPGRAPDGED
jgi:periplasmic divalent cation tolerance protein